MLHIQGLEMLKIAGKEKSMTDDERQKYAMMIQELSDKLDQMKGTVTPKNHRPGKADPNKKYVLLSKELSKWGKVPKQQEDLAKILSGSMEVGREYSQVEVFNMVIDGSGEFPSLYGSVQDPTYLLRYYTGLKSDVDREGNRRHGGFIARNFLRVR